MKVFESVSEYQEWRKTLPPSAPIGFVPTMGALHSGHAALLVQARKSNSVVVLSIYVNPTQFNQAEDFEKYPKTWEQDLEIAKAAGVDAVFAPKNPQELYPDAYRFRVTETEFSNELCGAFRPGHFDGVLTVVLKLFQIVKPTHAYFGEKDFQQLTLIQQMVQALFLDIQIVPCTTLREASGLALSSRNLRLSEAEKELAPLLYHTLKNKPDLEVAKASLESRGFKVEYLVDKKIGNSSRRFVAAWLGKVRLIDNVEI